MVNEEEELKREIDKLKRIESKPDIENVELKIIKSKNTHKETSKTFTQYKMNLPKEILDSITSDGTKPLTVNGTFDSSKNKLIIEIW